MKIDELDIRMGHYIKRNQTTLDGKTRETFTEEVSKKLNTIRQSTERTRRYATRKAILKSRRIPTTILTNRWVRDVEMYADEMHRFDEIAKANIFRLPDDFRTNAKTQEQYKNNVLELSDLYDKRLAEITKNMSEYDKKVYFDSTQSDRDFILSYFEQEKYQEKELSHDNSNIRKEEPTQEKIVTKQKPTNPEDKNFRYGSHEELMKRVDELRAKEKAKNKLKGIVSKGKGKNDDNWLPGSH